MKIQIKNMVCDRCKMAVTTEFKKLGLDPISVTLGEVQLDQQPSKDVIVQLEKALNELGFELIDDKRSGIIERIKNTVVELVHYKGEAILIKLSEYISSQVGYEYHYLSKLFSEIEGTTIEQYIINQKIERVKELLTYGQLSLNEIADELGYSSVQHLSQQFRKVTGLTASAYKQSKESNRRPLDQL